MTKTLTLSTSAQMYRYLEQVWQLLVASYASVKGGLHYADPLALLADTQRWRMVVRFGRVIAVTLFKTNKRIISCY